MIYVFFRFFLARTTEVGSRTLVAGAEAGKDSHGTYMDNSRPGRYAILAFCFLIIDA